MLLKEYWKNLCRIIDFIPVIWKMTDWDHDSSLRIYQKSLKRLESTIRSDENSKNNKRLADSMKVMIVLIDRINNDYPENERYEMLDKEFGESEYKLLKEENDFRFNERNLKRKSDEFFKKRMQYFKEETYTRKNDLETLGKLIAKWHPYLWT